MHQFLFVSLWHSMKVALYRIALAGYPVLRQKVEFRVGGRCANKEDWNKFIMALKVSL